ncbi:hypothetical protein [Burkholderia pseudomallei]
MRKFSLGVASMPITRKYRVGSLIARSRAFCWRISSTS